VKTLLLAESHVFTSHADRAIALPWIPELPAYPTDYAKFVYCLGYGERQLTGDPAHPRRDGTPQFWKIFFSCVNEVCSNEDFRPVQAITSYRRRLSNKIRLLQQLQSHGIWLVDTSIVALYDGGKKPTSKLMHDAIIASWDGYISHVIRDCAPEHVIVIGKGVARSIGANLKELVGDRYSVIPQPNAHLAAHEHLSNYRRYYQICSGSR